MIRNTLPDKSANCENLKKLSQHFESFSANVSIFGEDLLRVFYRFLIYSFVNQVVRNKALCNKAFTSNAIWKIFLYKNYRNYNSYRLSYKFAFIHFSSSLTNQKQESGFQQVGDVVTRNISGFCL